MHSSFHLETDKQMTELGGRTPTFRGRAYVKCRVECPRSQKAGPTTITSVTLTFVVRAAGSPSRRVAASNVRRMGGHVSWKAALAKAVFVGREGDASSVAD
jgi:hypothetical protein